MILGSLSWPATLQPLALVASPRQGLRQMLLKKMCLWNVIKANICIVDVFMLLKQELIFFRRFTFFYEGEINENILK